MVTKSKKALKHAEKRAQAKRRKKAKADAWYYAVTFRKEKAERLEEFNRPKAKEKPPEEHKEIA